MKLDLPILDGFYDETPYLTAEKCMNEKVRAVKERVMGLGLKTAVITWSFDVNVASTLPDFELLFESTVGHVYLYNNKILVYFATIGAPVAAGTMEELHAMGIVNFVAYGSAGCIVPGYDHESALVVEKAIRDEGTSYHYLPPSIYAQTDVGFTEKLSKFLKTKKIKHHIGTTWTTDAFFRETPGRIAKRIEQGAKAVEMESATLCAVAEFYGLRFCQFLYFSDVVSDQDWTWKDKTYRDNAKVAYLKIAIEFAESL